MRLELPDGRRWNGLAYLHDTPQDGCNCPTCGSLIDGNRKFNRAPGPIKDTAADIARSLTMRKKREHRIDSLIEALQIVREPAKYSNHDFDRMQSLTALFQQFAEEGKS